jgi:hypothetical protein
MVSFLQVSEFVHEYCVDHPLGTLAKSTRYPDLTRRWRARRPPGTLIVDPTDRTRHHGVVVQLGEDSGAFFQGGVTRGVLRTLSQQPLDEIVDESGSFSPAKPRRDLYDDATTGPVCSTGLFPPRRSPHFHFGSIEPWRFYVN